VNSSWYSRRKSISDHKTSWIFGSQKWKCEDIKWCIRR